MESRSGSASPLIPTAMTWPAPPAPVPIILAVTAMNVRPTIPVELVIRSSKRD